MGLLITVGVVNIWNPVGWAVLLALALGSAIAFSVQAAIRVKLVK